MKNLSKAILAVMKEVKGIDKTMTIGEGRNSYNGVPDQEVKKVIGEAMQKNGLCLLPISVEPKTRIDRWEQEDFYNGKSNGIKAKQSVFTECNTKYLLLHESGESIEVAGYGHGVDTQDKGAGKATTYALKYTLLYLFLVPTGKIYDSDNDHSDDKEVPKKKDDNAIIDAVSKLSNCKSIDDLSMFKSTLPNNVITNGIFKKAALAKYDSFKLNGKEVTHA